jgi:hypothetical protein
VPSIPISDGISIAADADAAPWSSLARYAQELPHLIADKADLSRWQILTLSDPALQSLDLGIDLEKPVTLADGVPQLTLGVGGALHTQVITGKLFSPDHYGDNIAIPDGQSALRIGVDGTASASATAPAGIGTFGFDASAGITFDSYRLFSSGADAPTVLDALIKSLGELVLPFSAEDVAAIPAGVVVTAGGTGKLKFSAKANLLAIANPLASVTLPASLPEVAVSQGASVKVGASWEIATEYQVRVQRLDSGRARLGWYRKHSSEFTVTASAGASITAGTSTSDLFPSIVAAISGNAQADEHELQQAGLTGARMTAIEGAVKSGVSRRLEVAVAAELGSLSSDEAAFLYELDFARMNETAHEALGRALHGDLSGFAEPPEGITEVRSILTRISGSHFQFKVNLLGIFNFVSISKLVLKGTVTWTPSTGELVIADEASATRIQADNVNFGADEEKLRHVMAESFLITAAYRGSRTALAPPQLKSTHSFFRLDNSTTREEMGRSILALSSVGFAVPELPGDVANFGRTIFNLEAAYDDAAALTLFLGSDALPRPVEEYESAGRLAIQRLVPPTGLDAYRLRPTTDDALWAQMKDVGPANFRQLFPETQAPVVAADYLAIRWWADSMHSTAQIVERILRPGAADSAALRQDLASHLRDVAARAHEQFGTPWGLVAMFLVSGRHASANGSITGSRFVFSSPRPLAAAG